MPDTTGWVTRSGDAPSDLVREMYLAVQEGAPLWQLPLEVTNYPSGGPVVHGPFDPADCSTVLLRWFDAGLLDCVALAWREIEARKVTRTQRDDAQQASNGRQHEYLDRTAARSVIADVSRWTADGPDAGVDLIASRAADSAFADWFERLDGLPAELIRAG